MKHVHIVGLDNEGVISGNKDNLYLLLNKLDIPALTDDIINKIYFLI